MKNKINNIVPILIEKFKIFIKYNSIFLYKNKYICYDEKTKTLRRANNESIL